MEPHVLISNRFSKGPPLVFTWICKLFGLTIITVDEYTKLSIEERICDVDLDHMQCAAGVYEVTEGSPTNININLDAVLENGLIPRSDEDDIKTLVDSQNSVA